MGAVATESKPLIPKSRYCRRQQCNFIHGKVNGTRRSNIKSHESECFITGLMFHRSATINQ